MNPIDPLSRLARTQPTRLTDVPFSVWYSFQSFLVLKISMFGQISGVGIIKLSRLYYIGQKRKELKTMGQKTPTPYRCDYREQWVFDDLYVMIGGEISNNTYVVVAGDEAIVVDPSFNGEKLLRFLKRKKIAKTAILLTHGHYDHVGDSVAVARACGAKVYLHENDLFLKTKLQAKYFEFMDETDNSFDAFVGFSKQLPKLGVSRIKPKAFLSPGHTPGSVSYQIGDYVFTGDFIFDTDVGRTDFPYSDPKLMRESIKAFVARYANRGMYLFPGHEEWTRVDDLALINPDVKKYFKA